VLLWATYAGAASVFLFLANRFVGRVSPAAGLTLALFPLLFTGRAFLIGGIYGPADLYFGSDPWRNTAMAREVGSIRNPILSDVAFANLPWRAAVREAISNGRFPFWNRFDLLGAPLFPGAGDSFLHPGTFPGIWLPLELSFTFSCTVTIFLGLLSAFLFFRDHEVSGLSALTGAAAWGFSTYLLFWNGFAIGPPVATFPLLLLGLRRLVRRPGAGSVGLLAAALLLGLTGGHPETFFHGLAGGAVYFLWEIFGSPTRRVLRPVASTLLGGLLAVLIGAPILLPLLDALPRTAVYHERLPGSGAADSVRQSVSARESARRLLPAALPFSHGIYGRSPVQDRRHDGSGMPMAYSGAVLFPLAVLALRGQRRGRYLFLGYYVAGLGYGASAPVLLDLTAALPGFHVALNWLMVSFAAFGLAGLAAFGADEIQREGKKGSAALACSAVLAVLIGWTVLARPVFRDRELAPAFIRREMAAELVPVAVLAVAAVASRRGGRALAVSALLLLAAQRRAEMGGVYPTLPRGSVASPLRFLEALPAGGSPYRVVARDDVFRPNAATLYGIEDVRGYEPFTLAELGETFPLWCTPRNASHQLVGDLARPFLSLANARFAIGAPGEEAPQSWSARSRDAEAALFENPRALGRAFVPRKVRTEPDGAARLEEMAAETDFGERAWLSVGSGKEVDNGRAEISVRESGADLLIDAKVESRALVATSIPAWPGWRALVGGARVETVRVNHAFVGLWLEPGAYEVRLSYRPPMWNLAVGLFVMGALLAVALAVASRKRDVTA